MTAGKVLYAKQDTLYIIKLVGEVRYTLSCSLDDFLDQLFKQDDYEDIVIDLTETEGIDSTNLGLLAKIANFMRERFARKPTLISPNEDINQVLDSVGFEEVFDIHQETPIAIEAESALNPTIPDKAKLARTLLETHRILSDLNEQNREMFKDVVEALQSNKIDKN